MDKYYTPELEEFHVGFEYETIYLQDYDTWKKEILEEDDAGYFHSIYFRDAVPTEFRVKLLDKEDIESLGFTITKDNEEIELNLESKRYIGGPSAGDDYKIIILYGLDNKEMWIYKQCNNGYEYDLFKGLIKNKSELRKLLKQLGIE